MINHTLIFGIIAITVLSSISPASADEKPYNITGNWYVVAIRAYNVYLPFPRCWNIQIEELSQDIFKGTSTFINADHNSVSVQFNATRTETFTDMVQTQYLTVMMTMYGTGITLIDTMKLEWNPENSAAVLSYRYKTDPKLHFWRTLYMQRHSELLGFEIPTADFFVDTTCP